MVEIILKQAEKKKINGSYLEDIVKPHLSVLKAFNRLGEILYCYQNEKEERQIAKIDEEAKEKISGYNRHTLSLLCITKYFFDLYFNSKDEEDSINIPNSFVDMYNKEGSLDIFNDSPNIVKERLNKVRDYEGMGVLLIDSYSITNNGLFIPPASQIKLEGDFNIEDDIDLIIKVSYPIDYPLDEWPNDVNPPEIGTKTKSMLIYSKKHPEVSFIALNKYNYIIQNGKVINKKTPDYFKELC